MTRSLLLYPLELEKAPVFGGFRVLRWIKKPVGWLTQYRQVTVALGAVLLVVACVVFADYLTPYDPNGPMTLSNRLRPPFWVEGGSLAYPLGTDNLGRDMLSRTLHGGAISLWVAFVAGTLSAVLGVIVGLISGFAGGLVDRILLGITDVWLSFPFLVLALAVIATVGNSVVILTLLLSLAGWVHAARVTRVQTMKILQLDYVRASIAFGASPFHILRYHVLPGVVNINVVMWTFSVSTLILIEGSLSFVGLGISPDTPSWGNMLNDGRTYLRDAWWMSIFPGLALMLTVLSVNNLGDVIQKLYNHQG